VLHSLHHFAATSLLLTGLLIGCSDGRPPLVPATGQVLFQNQPLTAGSITFYPDTGNAFQGDAPSSQLQLDGNFQMKTFPWGPGITEGRYRITLSAELAARIKRPDYASREKSPLQVTVPPEGLTNYKIEIP
jgi:hypothetical protein